jgi:hypothetical protein
VLLAWTTVSGATSYEVTRRFNGGSEQIIATPASAGFTDNSVSSGSAYLYRVRAVAPGGTSTFSPSDLATTIVFTEDPLAAAVTPIRAAHLTQIRSGVNAVRSLAALSGASFTDATVVAGVTPVRSVHVTELRSALNAALSALGLPAASFANGVAPGVIVKAADFQELRAALK